MTKMVTKTRAAATVWKSCATWSKSCAPCAALWVLRPSPGSSAAVARSGSSSPSSSPGSSRRLPELPAHSFAPLPPLTISPGGLHPPYAPPMGELPPLRGLRPPSCAFGAPRFAPLALPWCRRRRCRGWPRRRACVRSWARWRPCWSGKGLPISSGGWRPSETAGGGRGPRARDAMSQNVPNVKSATCSRGVVSGVSAPASGFFPGSLRGFWPGSRRPERGPGERQGGGHVESGPGSAGN